ncbi:MAG: hypothetical protein HY259_04035 [Chloroflexi bacterium]|nr:hypothetical protein [Chloroflexota bacterium]MBI3732613.1 hypothetical protein [Chloroflexota bacterium]
MDCPYGDFQGKRGEVHRHLAEAHAEQVQIRQDEMLGQRLYEITCPVCAAPYEHVINSRSRDPRFLREFDAEIRLVAFDMLLYHMQGEHGAG